MRYALIAIYAVFILILVTATYLVAKGFIEGRAPIYAPLIPGVISIFIGYRLYLACVTKPKETGPKGIRVLSWLLILAGGGALLLALFANGGIGLVASGAALLGIGLWNIGKQSSAA